MSKDNDDKEMPLLSFYFEVEIGDDVLSFQEVTGLKATMETENVVEGGNNNFAYSLPVRVTYDNLRLSRGVFEKDSGELHNWLDSCFAEEISEEFGDKCKPITVSLLNPEGEPVKVWAVSGAFPIEWEAPTLNATTNKIAMESLVLTYRYLVVDPDENNKR